MKEMGAVAAKDDRTALMKDEKMKEDWKQQRREKKAKEERKH